MHILCTAARFDDRRMTINRDELQNRKKKLFSKWLLWIQIAKSLLAGKRGKGKNLLHLIDPLGAEFVETVQVYRERRNINRRVFSSKPLDRSLAVALQGNGKNLPPFSLPSPPLRWFFFFNFLFVFCFFTPFFASPHYGSWSKASLIEALKNEIYRTSITLVSSHHRNFISLTVYT